VLAAGLTGSGGEGGYTFSSPAARKLDPLAWRRHGFRVTRELTVPGGGPTLWLMWREPEPGTGSR